MRLRARVPLALFAVAAVIGLVLVILNRSPKPPTYPTPNGYDTLVAAANLTTSLDPKDRYASIEDLRIHVTNNASALRMAREGLVMPSRVRLPSTTTGVRLHLLNLAAITQLAIALATEGRLAEGEGDAERALACHLDAVRFAQAVSRGGAIVDRLNGISLERMALDEIRRLKLQLTNTVQIVRELETIQANDEPASVTISTERNFSSRIGGFRIPC